MKLYTKKIDDCGPTCPHLYDWGTLSFFEDGGVVKKFLVKVKCREIDLKNGKETIVYFYYPDEKFPTECPLKDIN
jgi:hypothetical protein